MGKYDRLVAEMQGEMIYSARLKIFNMIIQNIFKDFLEKKSQRLIHLRCWDLSLVPHRKDVTLFWNLRMFQIRGFQAMISWPSPGFYINSSHNWKTFLMKVFSKWCSPEKNKEENTHMLVFISVCLRNSPYICWSHWCMHHLSVDKKKPKLFCN